jgi:NTE family protein
MKNGSKPTAKSAGSTNGTHPATGAGQIVLVFQGGGALGAYQAGVYQALHEAGIEPDWIIGTSIGAINASLIAGNAPENRVARLQEFWRRMSHKSIWDTGSLWPQLTQSLSYLNTVANGVPNFFVPNLAASLGPNTLLGAEQAGYYSTAPLEKTLLELVDFQLTNACKPRLTVGAAHVCTSQMHYFDSRDMALGVKHIMASGALPPAFPAVRVDGELYWDGGILSNTPTEIVFDDNPRRNSLIFAVHVWNPVGPEPETIAEVLHRQKDIQYSSRVANHIERQLQTHRLRHVINKLVSKIPESERNTSAVRELAGWGCVTQMHIVRLLAPSLAHENHTKDVDFSPSGIRKRWEAGYANTQNAIERKPWIGEFDPLEGVILHQPLSDEQLESKNNGAKVVATEHVSEAI